LVTASRGFGLLSDPGKNTVGRPTFDPVDRFPTQDCALTLPKLKVKATPQVLKGKLSGWATITLNPKAGLTLTNVVRVGDDTTFDINVAADTPQNPQAVMTFTDTQRTPSSPVNSGFRKLVINADGYPIGTQHVLVTDYADKIDVYDTWRPIHLSGLGINTHVIAPEDRQSDDRWEKPNGPLTIGHWLTMEDAVRAANQYGKNLWWHVGCNYNDTLIAEVGTYMRDNLDPSLKWYMEIGLENWNVTFNRDFWIVAAMDLVNGFVGTACRSVYTSNYNVTSNVATVTMERDHAIAVGDQVLTNKFKTAAGVVFGTAGVKTITSTPAPDKVTWDEVYANVPETKAASLYLQGPRVIVSAISDGTQMTFRFGKEHGMSVGQTVGVVQFTGVAANPVITAVPNTREIVVPCTTPAGSVTVGGGASVIGNINHSLCSGGVKDQFVLGRRMYAKRTCEISVILQSIYAPSDFGNRLNVVLMDQPGADQEDTLSYIAAEWGPVTNYLNAIGQAAYYFYDATKSGGPNLRNATTYNGNTPPSAADYNAAQMLTVAEQKTSLRGRYDLTAMNSARYRTDDRDLKRLFYEYGPDPTANPANSVPGIGGPKIDACFTPASKDIFRLGLDDLEANGFDLVMNFIGGMSPIGETDEFGGWGVFRDYAPGSPAPRADAAAEKNAAPKNGPTRNRLNASGLTNIDPRQIIGIFSSAGPYPDLAAGFQSKQDWVITAPITGEWEFTPTFSATKATAAVLEVNGTAIGTEYAIPIGTSVPAARTLFLRQGVNSIRFKQGTLALKTYAQATNFAFTKN
jgi:hypothetical protein